MGPVSLPLKFENLILLFYYISRKEHYLFLQDTGLAISPYYATIILGVIQVLGCVIATLIVNRVGRKLLLSISLTICSLTMSGLGTTTYFVQQDQTASPESALRWLSLAFLIVFVLGFTLGLGPVPWILVGELRPGILKFLPL